MTKHEMNSKTATFCPVTNKNERVRSGICQDCEQDVERKTKVGAPGYKTYIIALPDALAARFETFIKGEPAGIAPITPSEGFTILVDAACKEAT